MTLNFDQNVRKFKVDKTAGWTLIFFFDFVFKFFLSWIPFKEPNSKTYVTLQILEPFNSYEKNEKA